MSVSAARLSILTYTVSDVAGNQEATRSLSVFVGVGRTTSCRLAFAAPTPTFGLPIHGSLVLTGTLAVNGQSKSFTKTVKF